MRIASISKAITMTAVGRLIEEGKLDLDKPVTEYVKSWPSTHPTMTTRQLVSHTAGVRHYLKKGDKVDDESDTGDAKYAEFRSKEKFESVESALNIFKNDELLSSPGMPTCLFTLGFIKGKLFQAKLLITPRMVLLSFLPSSRRPLENRSRATSRSSSGTSD